MSVHFVHSVRKCSFVSILFLGAPCQGGSQVYYFFLSVNMYCVFRALWHCILLCCSVWVFQWLIYSLPFLSVSIPVCLRRSWTTKLQLFVTVLLVCPGWPPDVSVCRAHGLLFVGAMCSHVDCLSPPILLLNHCFSGSSCVSLVTLVCLPI